jgi:hypothetical protein
MCRVDHLIIFMCRLLRNSEIMYFLVPYGPVQACIRMAVPHLPFNLFNLRPNFLNHGRICGLKHKTLNSTRSETHTHCVGVRCLVETRRTDILSYVYLVLAVTLPHMQVMLIFQRSCTITHNIIYTTVN